LLDIESRAGIQRKQTSGEWTRMDAFTLAYHQRVRQGYLDLAAAEPQRWLKLDAARPADEVQAELRQVILERLRARA
jgi:dTMP kinase